MDNGSGEMDGEGWIMGVGDGWWGVDNVSEGVDRW